MYVGEGATWEKWKKKWTENENIYYLEETCVIEGHSVDRVWKDKNIKIVREAFVQGCSTSRKEPTGWGQRLIVTHTGSVDGFFDYGLVWLE